MLDVARLEGEAKAGTLAAFRLGAGADAGAAVVARETRGMCHCWWCGGSGSGGVNEDERSERTIKEEEKKKKRVIRVIRENPASRGTEASAEVLVGPPMTDGVERGGQQQWYERVSSK